MRYELDVVHIPVDARDTRELATIAKMLARMTGGDVWHDTRLLAQPPAFTAPSLAKKVKR